MHVAIIAGPTKFSDGGFGGTVWGDHDAGIQEQTVAATGSARGNRSERVCVLLKRIIPMQPVSVGWKDGRIPTVGPTTHGTLPAQATAGERSDWTARQLNWGRFVRISLTSHIRNYNNKNVETPIFQFMRRHLKQTGYSELKDDDVCDISFKLSIYYWLEASAHAQRQNPPDSAMSCQPTALSDLEAGKSLLQLLKPSCDWS